MLARPRGTRSVRFCPLVTLCRECSRNDARCTSPSSAGSIASCDRGATPSRLTSVSSMSSARTTWTHATGLFTFAGPRRPREGPRHELMSTLRPTAFSGARRRWPGTGRLPPAATAGSPGSPGAGHCAPRACLPITEASRGRTRSSPAPGKTGIPTRPVNIGGSGRELPGGPRGRPWANSTTEVVPCHLRVRCLAGGAGVERSTSSRTDTLPRRRE